MKLQGRVILVVGAYGGLGEATALACAREGATLVLLGKRAQKLNRVYDAVKAVGPEPAAYPLDLAGAGPADYEDMVKSITGELGDLHGIVHCAAAFEGLSPLQNSDPEQFVAQMHINFTAPWLLSQACLPVLRAQTDSAIVFVADAPERVGLAYWGAYGLAKQATISLMHMLHQETEKSNVRVSALQPPPMRTALRAKAFLNEEVVNCCLPSQVAPDCVRLLSPEGLAYRGQVLISSGAA